MATQVMDRAVTVAPVSQVVERPRVMRAARPVARPMPRLATERAIVQATGPQVRCARSERSQGYTLSRWQRLAMTIIAGSAVVVGVAVTVSAPTAPVGGQVTAQPGDTVGSIVLREMPGADPLRAMELVEALNHLDGGEPAPGATVLLPALP